MNTKTFLEFDESNFWEEKTHNYYCENSNPNYMDIANAIDDFVDRYDFYIGYISDREIRNEVNKWKMDKDEVIFAIYYCENLNGVKNINRLINILKKM